MRVLRPALPISLTWLTLCLCGWPGPGYAQAQRPLAEAVHVESGATCVTAASLTPQIAAWLGTTQVDAELTVSVSGSASDARDVVFKIHRGTTAVAERRFKPAPFVCAQLEATLALAIAMALKVSLRDELLDVLGGVETRGVRVSLGGLVRVGYAMLPGTSLGVGLAAMQPFGRHFALRGEVFADGARNATFDNAPGGGFDSWLLSGQVSGCALFPLHPSWNARACLGIAIGGLEVRGRGYKESNTAWLPWVAAANSLGLSVELSRHWWLDLPVGLVVPLNKLTFGVERRDGSVVDVQTLPRAGLSVAAGPQYHF